MDASEPQDEIYSVNKFSTCHPKVLRMRIFNSFFYNSLMPGGSKKATHTSTNQQLSAAGLFKYR